MANPANHKTIRIPVEIFKRIERLQEEIMTSYENGRTDKPNITEQGGKAWVSKGEVIRIGLDEFESHKRRSRAKKKK